MALYQTKVKIAKIIPIYKKGDHQEPSNYRPISLLKVFDKMLEKIVYKRLYSFFEKNDILYKYQFGFRKNHSTSLALLEVVDSCYKSLDGKNKIIGIYLVLILGKINTKYLILIYKKLSTLLIIKYY